MHDVGRLASASSLLPGQSRTTLALSLGYIDSMRVLAEHGTLESPRELARALRALLDAGELNVPVPGRGATPRRFEALAELAAIDLSLARLAEGHTDAVAILAEADAHPAAGCYGVWAAEPKDARLRAERHGDGWIVHGTKRYCSGAHGLQRALVTASAPDGARLFDVDLAASGLRVVEGTWHAVGMAATESLDVQFEGVSVPSARVVGAPGFYLARRGFWSGAVGVAACWYGGALGAYRMLRKHLQCSDPSDHQAAHLGAIAATVESMWTSLAHAARCIDAGTLQRNDALVVRHIVEQGCQEVLLRVGRASGTTPLTFDRAHARRAADLPVYLRQHHAERDLATLGRALLDGS